MIWIIFLCAAIAIFISGQRLTKSADQLAEETGISRGFIGVILLGFVTSLPELVSTVSAALFCNAPNLALGNIFGSNAANLAILAFLNLIVIHSAGQARHKLDEENQLTAYLSLIIISLALMGLAGQGFWHILHIDFFSLLIATAYIIGLQKLHRFQLSEPPNTASTSDTPIKIIPPELKRSLLINAGIIVAASMTLAASAEHIASITGWGTTFVGNSLLAIATSLPEIVVTFSAVRIGSFSMAAGNIFGSNIFNIAILAVADLFYFRSSIFAAASPSQSLIAAIGLLMTGLYLFAGHYASEKRLAGRWPVDSLLVVGVYLFSLYALFSLR
ncbi:MAG: sodium:calcium antiporter [Deltaproteobacteria bacterium]|nr:sodium:calcium antiporter [Candidatus Tharpella aukensis]